MPKLKLFLLILHKIPIKITKLLLKKHKTSLTYLLNR